MSTIQYCSCCDRLARFEIGKIDRKTKEFQWLSVCGSCDSKIGIKNLVAQGLTRPEAVKINREVKRHD